MLEETINTLNDTHREAVLHTEGPLLVLAGAGSGKTRVLTVRVAHLLFLGVAPWRVMAITFTNRAANEMKSRLGRMVPDRAGDLWVSTFHAACLRILRRDAERVGFARDFAVFDSADQQTLIRDCLNELRVPPGRFTPQAVHAVISRAKNELLGPEVLESRVGNSFEAAAAKVFGLYQEKLRSLGAMDFDDLLLLRPFLLRRAGFPGTGRGPDRLRRLDNRGRGAGQRLRRSVPSGKIEPAGVENPGQFREAGGKMLIIPAIDLRGGRCVRLVKGRMERETVYGEDPVAVALGWQEQGAQRLHVVDLDGAIKGSPATREIVARIVRAVRIPVQTGGGVRDREAVDRLFALGVDRVVLGTAAVKDPQLLAQC